MGFPGDTRDKESVCNAGDARDVGLIPVFGRSLGGGNGNTLQYSCLKNSMNRGVWWVTVHGVTKSWTQLSMHAQRKHQVVSRHLCLPRVQGSPNGEPGPSPPCGGSKAAPTSSPSSTARPRRLAKDRFKWDVEPHNIIPKISRVKSEITCQIKNQEKPSLEREKIINRHQHQDDTDVGIRQEF